MGCAGCSVSDNGTPKGCRSNGHCASGGCNKMNTFDWITSAELEDPLDQYIAEISFKHGARKGFFNYHQHFQITTGDWVVVDTGNGSDVGRVSLMGPLVELQMKKKKTPPEKVVLSVLRPAGSRDLQRMQDAREKEKRSLVKSRAIARTMGLEMKIGDVEYQADGKKATFYYTADGRVDFRELVRTYAKEFKVKIEMRQIGARQESARIGGLGPCGRELCCSTWLSDFKSVSTVAARYQNLAINQAKLSGQCGRLKCCLNYELETYLEALEEFPQDADVIETQSGKAHLIKLDIFKGLMYYSVPLESQRNRIIALTLESVHELLNMAKSGTRAEDILTYQLKDDLEEDIKFADGTGEIELPVQKRNRRKGRRKPKSDHPKNQSNRKKPSSNQRNRRRNRKNQNNKKNES